MTPPQQQPIGYNALAALCLVLAAAGAIGIAALSEQPLYGIALIGGLCAIAPLCLRADLGASLLLFSLLAIDEFPSGLGETVERSTRTAFYSKSLGLPGMYGPDALLFIGLAVLLAHIVIRRRGLTWKIDPIAIALAVLAGAGGVSAIVSLVFDTPFSDVIIEKTTGVGFDVNDRALTFIAAFQFKIFYMLFAGYVLGRYYFNEEGSVARFIKVFMLAIGANVLMGFARLGMHPTIVTTMSPLFYDSPSTWIFALAIFYILGAWAQGTLPRRHTLWLMLLVGVLAFFILVSFRRTMWAGCALCGAILLAMLPGKARSRLVMLGAIGAALGVVALGATGGGIFGSVLGRVEQTNIEDASTLYRLAIFVHMKDTYDSIPVFGFGFRPLWNRIAALGYFQTNVENIHSLYFWWWLRTGIFGMVAGAFVGVTIFFQTWRTWRRATVPRDKLLALCALLAWVMMAFSGIFNPVYGEVRYVVLAGFGLALVSRLREAQQHPPPPRTLAAPARVPSLFPPRSNA